MCKIVLKRTRSYPARAPLSDKPSKRFAGLTALRSWIVMLINQAEMGGERAGEKTLTQ